MGSFVDTSMYNIDTHIGLQALHLQEKIQLINKETNMETKCYVGP